MTIRPSLARAALACAFVLGLVPLLSWPPSSFAEPPCALQGLIDEALATSTAGRGEATVVPIDATCSVETTVELRTRPPGAGNDTVYVTLTGEPVVRGETLTGPMFVVRSGFGLILRGIAVDGGGADREPRGESEPMIRVDTAAFLTVGDGAALTDHAGRAIVNHGVTTVVGPDALISRNTLTVRPGDKAPGGAAILTESHGTTVIEGGVIADNLVRVAPSEGSAQAPNVAGGAVMSIGTTRVVGGRFEANSFDVSESSSFGGAIAAVMGTDGSAGTVTVSGASAAAAQFVGNSATRGGAIAALSIPEEGGSGVTLAGGVFAGNIASADGGALYINGGSAEITTGAVIGSDDAPNQAARAGRSGVVNASGVLALSGAPVFAGGNGITAATEDVAPTVTGPLSGGPASVPLESIPYFGAPGGRGEVVAARVGEVYATLSPADAEALTQADPVMELALGDAGAVIVARYRSLPVTYHGLAEATNSPENPESVTYISPTAELRPPSEPDRQHFVGWFDAPEGGNAVAAIAQGTTAPVDVWARFVPTYRVTYRSPAEDQVSAMPVDPGEYYVGLPASVLADAPFRP
ncbi:MAG: hypothetical protein LBK59_09460, partial [Bifidobacteriaceae bacterium]|nr:hypothetical protein [Bifidobacteriaceae bacterium]